MSKIAGFVPRNAKTVRIREIIKEVGYFLPFEDYAKIYFERFKEKVSIQTVMTTIQQMRRLTC